MSFRKELDVLAMNRSSTDRADVREGSGNVRQVLDCGSLAAFLRQSAGGPAQSKTLARGNPPHSVSVTGAH
jgi:hypothetical protein